MVKMGIFVIFFYCGGFNFEVVGLFCVMVVEFFSGMISCILGIGVVGIQKKVEEVYVKGFGGVDLILFIGGFYKVCKFGESYVWGVQIMYMM